MHAFPCFLTLLCAACLLLHPLRTSPAEEKTDVKRVRFYTVSPEGGTAKLFLVPGDYHTAGSPAFSADGQKLAFDGRKSQLGEKFADGKILVCNSDGSNLSAIGSGVMPSWSPGGNRIAFSNLSPSGGALIHVDGTGLQMIDSSGWGAQWSPDGRKVVSIFYLSRKAYLRINDLIEGTTTDLFPEGESPYSRIFWNMAWSPDSNWICFKAQNAEDNNFHVATINSAGKAAGFKVHYQHKTAPYADIAWHPQGESIVFAAGSRPRQFLHFNPAEDKPPAALDIKVKGDIIGDVCFTPDGQSLLFNVSGTEE